MFYSNFEHIEDAIVWGKLLVILGELSLLPQDPVAWDYGPHRLYQVMVLRITTIRSVSWKSGSATAPCPHQHRQHG